MRSVRALGVVITVCLSTGCGLQIAGIDCDEPCAKIWSPDECDVQVPGVHQDIMYEECVDHCRTAKSQGGELLGYDPWEHQTDGTAIELINRAQAREWAECVMASPCGDLVIGFCAPI